MRSALVNNSEGRSSNNSTSVIEGVCVCTCPSKDIRSFGISD